MKPLADSATLFKSQSGPEPNPSLDLRQESFPFTPEEIDRAITKKSPGIFALGYPDEDDQFVVKAIGRADQDLKDELSVRLMFLMGADLLAGPEDDLRSKLSRFTFEYATTAEEAFEKECLEYHELWETGVGVEELDDRGHPKKEKDGRRAFCPIWQCAWNY